MPAAAFKASLGNNFNNTSGTTLAITTTAAIAAGDFVVVRWAADNLSATTPTATCADSGGNTYTVQRQAAANATAAAGIAGGLLTSLATVAVASGGTITLTFSGAIVGKAAYAESFTNVANSTRVASVGSSAASGTAATSGTSAGGILVGDLVLGFSAVQTRVAATGDIDTSNGTWSTIKTINGGATSSADTGSVQINGQYKIVISGAGAQTYDNTVTSTYWIAGLVAMQCVPDPSITQAAYRFYADGTESASTALAAENTSYNADVTAGNVNLLLRTRLQSTTAVAFFTTDDWQLQWSRGDVYDHYDFGNYSGSSFSVSSVQTQVAQSFTATTGGPLRQATFYLAKLGAPTGTVNAVLYAHDGGTFGSTGLPTGSALATSTTSVTASTIPVLPQAYSFDFDGTFTLAAGTPYFIGLVATGATGGVSQAVAASSDNTSPTYPGNVAFFQSVWAANTTNDLCFEVGSAWVNVTTAGTGVAGFNSANLTDGAVTTNRLTAGTGSFVTGKVSEDGLVDDLGLTANNYTEVLYAVTLKQADLANGDTLRFRVLYNGATIGMTYTQIPTIPITKTVGQPKIYSGSVFAKKPLKVYSGSSFAAKPVKVWTGSTWKTLT